jgi:NAD(P)-dependent dehydrogenase (short-subunit alcohol dehydrogenase family)
MALVEDAEPFYGQIVSQPVVNNIKWDFTGQVVLVTGGARSQGRAHALSFARAGATVVVADLCHDLASVPWPLGTEEELQQVVREIEKYDVRALPVKCDVRDAAQVKAMVDKAIGEFGKIDILINNAGIYPFNSVFDLTEDAWDETIDTDLKGVFLCSKYVSEHMRNARKGKIVITGSTSSFLSAARHTPYTAAKHGVIGLCKGLAIDLAPYGINVNVVCPGGVYTPHVMKALMEAAEANSDPSQDVNAGIMELGGPWNLFGNEESLHPEDISNAMMFLASDAARYITGQTLIVDQGFSIK